MNVEMKMKFDHLLLYDGLVFLVYSLAALIFTRDLMALHGVNLGEAGIFTTQIAAGAFFAFSYMNLMARHLTDKKAIRMVTSANFVKHIFSLVVSFGTYISGDMNDQRILSFVLLFSLFTVVFAYYQFFGVATTTSE